ncbi:ASCH domain-containing protein [Microtetraspora malaysiensis]|uniref:ASCH domain-containing protein n=1 Tax=Microtetraspora malaysiensis TaxID=161358 RepID=UPI003D92A885
MRALELGSPGALRDELNGLVLAGAKTATATLLVEYGEEGEQLEFPGERFALLGNQGDVLATVEIATVATVSFGEVTWEFAQAEGEGYTDIEHWRRAHIRFWQQVEGRHITDDTAVVCVHFTLCR